MTMTQQALSYEQYLDGLPAERRAEIERVWSLVRENVPDGYVEEVGAKFLSFKTGDDWLVALANQKNYISLHLIPLYMFPEMKAKFDAAASAKLKCGKGCVNFKRAEELPLEVVGEIVRSHEAVDYAERMRQIRLAKKPPRQKAEGKD
ncbi:MAG TPA: DUF1801 domain-containing protein [Pyrinomonadaceae bacterium]|nr:DUF1801 domain-containing protein [Pyrinomonadaceae bacterium]